MIIYDCEIIKAIPPKNGSLDPDVEYCEGWHDHAGMGISVIGAYDYAKDRYRVFCADNFDEFQALVADTDIIIGFNSLSFDNRLCEANDIAVLDAKSWDLLVEIWGGVGLGPKFQYPSHAGYSLDNVAEANFEENKSGHGALAPVLWQQGKIGEVIDYCLQDVRLTKKLVDRILRTGHLINPKSRTQMAIRRPAI